MSQRLNIILDCSGQTPLREALSDLGFYFKNEIYASVDFPLTESAFAKYNAAVAAVNNAVLSTAYEGEVYLQFLNVEAIWGV
jgi:hypothetical protein